MFNKYMLVVLQGADFFGKKIRNTLLWPSSPSQKNNIMKKAKFRNVHFLCAPPTAGQEGPLALSVYCRWIFFMYVVQREKLKRRLQKTTINCSMQFHLDISGWNFFELIKQQNDLSYNLLFWNFTRHQILFHFHL